MLWWNVLPPSYNPTAQPEIQTPTLPSIFYSRYCVSLLALASTVSRLTEEKTRNAKAASQQLCGTNPILMARRAPIYETFVFTPALGPKVSPTKNAKAFGIKSWALFLAPMSKIGIHSYVFAPNTFKLHDLIQNWMRQVQTRFFVNAAKVNNFLYESSQSNCSPANNQQAPTTSRFKSVGKSKTKDSRFLGLDINKTNLNMRFPSPKTSESWFRNASDLVNC